MLLLGMSLGIVLGFAAGVAWVITTVREIDHKEGESWLK